MSKKIDEAYEKVCHRLLVESSIDLGNIEFAPDRIDVIDTIEQNTPEEEDVWEALNDWVRHGKMTPAAREKFQALMSHPKYGKFFKTLSGGTVYRGMVIKRSQVAGWLGIDQSELPEHSMPIPFPRAMRPTNLVANSWTKSRVEAGKFAGEHREITWNSGNLSVVFSARTEDNPGVFLDVEHMLKKLQGFSKYLKEEEVLALGPVKGASIEWSTPKISSSAVRGGSLASMIKANLAALSKEAK